MLAEVAARFAAARADLGKVIDDFPKESTLQQQAQWELANSYLTEARAISAVSPTLARGQFVRAARELREVAAKYPNHPHRLLCADALGHRAGIGSPRIRGGSDPGVERTGDLRPDQPPGPAGPDKTAAAYETT